MTSDRHETPTERLDRKHHHRADAPADGLTLTLVVALLAVLPAGSRGPR